MATQTREPVSCECGHKGFVTISQSQSAFSGFWESYGLDGFTGRTLMVTNHVRLPADMPGALEPTCPACGETGKVSYDKRP